MGVLRWLILGGIAIAHSAAADVPVYLRLDGRFYQLDPGITDPLQVVAMKSADSPILGVVEAAALANCRVASGASNVVSTAFLLYQPRGHFDYLSSDYTKWRYRVRADYAVFEVESSNGDLICDHEVAPPAGESPSVFRNGFEVPP